MNRDLFAALEGDDRNSLKEAYESMVSKPIGRKEVLKLVVKPSYSIAPTGNRGKLEFDAG